MYTNRSKPLLSVW